MNIRLVAAIGKKRELGKDNKLLWRLPKDLQHFKEKTLRKPVLMGRKTFESIGRPLPHRTNIVLTRNMEWQAEGVIVISSFEEALQYGVQQKGEEICVIGGAQIYALALPFATHLSLTFVHAEDPEADTFFPEWDTSQWREVSRQFYAKDMKNEIDFSFVEIEKI